MPPRLRVARRSRRARLSRLEDLQLSRSLNVEQLEQRRLLSITYDLTDVLQAYNTGAAAVESAATAAAVVDQVLGTDALPLANQTLDQGLSIASDFLKPFQTTLDQNAPDWNTIAAQLQAAGFLVQVPFTGTPDANNDLLEVSWAQTLTPSDPIQILGNTGFSYLDAGGGGLRGNIAGTGSVTLGVTFGVDVNPTTQSLDFFIAPGNVVQASLSGSTAANGLSGTIAIGDLASVNVTATAGVSFTGTLGLKATAAETDGKLRTADLTNNLSQVVTGGVNGSAYVNASLSAQLFGLPSVTWTGSLTMAVTNNAIQPEVDNLQGPSASDLLSTLGSSIFSLGDNIPILGPLSNALNQPLPIIGQSIGQLTGLDNDVPVLPSLPGNPLPSGLDNGGSDLQYQLPFGTLTVNVNDTTIGQFIRGVNVDLISWEASDDITLFSQTKTINVFSLGLPDIASLDLNARFGIYGTLHYDIGFGLDGHGFYALAGTPSHPTFGVTFGVTAGLQGQLELFNLPLAQAGGDLGFSVTPYISLTAAPASVDKQTDPNKIYFSDLALFGKDPLSDLLDDVSAGIEGDITGDVYAKINLLFFSIGRSWGINIPVFNFEHSPTWPSASGSGPGPTFWQNVTQTGGGVLTFNGTAADDDLTLSQGSNGSLTIAWARHGSRTFNGVTSFVFNGGSGNDTLTASGLDLPVRAVGGSGNDDFNLSGNSGNNTLIAGTAHNTLVGGSGADLLIGGDGSDVITAGSGTTTIDGGSGNASVTLGAGNDSFYGGSGNYNIQGGIGSYIIQGGSGSDVINAGSGLDDMIYGGSAGGNVITGSSAGHSTIYGGGPGDTLVGLGGYNIIYGSVGSKPGAATNNVITGGPLGDNLIFGGGGGDVLAGGGGNNTLYAGTGNETLAGGDGLDLVVNPSGAGLDNSGGDGKSSGNNLLIGGTGNDTMFGDSTGQNTLQAGPGNDTLYAGPGGDALIAGLGSDGLYGSIGDDTFQLPFTPAGETQPNDTLVGGGGSDTLYVKAESGSGTPGLDVTADTIPDATTTAVTVSNGSPLAADLAANGSSGLVMQIGSEQMLVTAVSGNVLTVERGYDNTTPAPHGNNALIVLPDTVPALPAPSDYELYLNQAGAADAYTATLSTLRFATTTADSTTVTNIDSTAGLAVGQAVTGPGIAAGTTITAIASNTSITLSTPAMLSQGNLPLTFGVIGSLSINLPGDIANIQLEGGPGNNWLHVDPSVTRDVTLYGGPGYNVLMSGSGNDALIAGPGTAVLYGGSGQDTFYAGDLPSQDVAPTGGTLTVTNNTGNPVDGNDTLIAGPGNDELFAGTGNDLLIGGSVARLTDPVTGTPGVALLQNGQYQLVEGAGRDLLVGGTGNDVLIAGPGGPGAILEAGTGNNTLIAQNYGIDTFSGGKGAGHTLILGGNLENTEISNSAAGGGNTLVGGLGIDNIMAGAGNDVLYSSYNAAAWSQGEAAAAAVGVHVVPPQFFQGDANSQQLQALLEEEQAGTLPASQRPVLGNLLLDELETLQNQESSLTGQVENYLNLLNQSSDVNPALAALLNSVDQQDGLVLSELQTLITEIQGFIGGSPFQPDSLTGGAGNDTFYGNVGGATFMGGGTGSHYVFYNYNSSDTVVGGAGGDNTLVLQGDGSMTLSPDPDPNKPNAVDFTVNGGQPLPVGDTGNMSLIQNLEIVTGSGNDTVTVNLASLPPGSPPPGLSGLEVLCGSGNDTVDASAFTGNETITAGSGNDVIKVGGTIGAASQITGTPTSELDIEDTTDLPVTVSHAMGLQVGSFTEPTSVLRTFGKLVVVGGAGTNNFTTDGSIANVVLKGGSGSNIFSVTGGTATLMGGGGADNQFTVIGPGNYDVIGGAPTVTAAPTTSGVAAPAPAGMTETTSQTSTAYDNFGIGRDWAISVGTEAMFPGTTSGGGTVSEVDIYDASTRAWSSSIAPVDLGSAAATTVGGQALFAGAFLFSSTTETVSNDLYIYNGGNGQWSTVTPPPAVNLALDDIAATTVGSMAIFAGGAVPENTGNSPIVSKSVDIYDAATGRWSTTSLPEAGYDFAATSIGTKAFFAGGNTDLIQIYDASAGAWSSYTLPGELSNMAATTVGTKAVFAGGQVYGAGGFSNVAYIYDAATGQWSTAALSQARQYLAATTIGTDAIFAGGQLPGYSKYSNVVDIYDAANGQWSTATISQAREDIAATTVANQALFAGGDGASGVTNAVDVFTFPTAVSNITLDGTTGGTTGIDYTLTGIAATASIQVQYSVNGGLWQNATPATGGDGTTGVAVSAAGTRHTFYWNSGQDLDAPADTVQVRITPMDAIGTGDTVASPPFVAYDAVGGTVNELTIDFNDSSNDTVRLAQSGQTVSFNGSLAGGSMNLLGSATNLTKLTVKGGTGDNLINAAAVQMRVNLFGGAGPGADTLVGGSGGSTLYYSGANSVYDGGTGPDNVLDYATNPGDQVAFGMDDGVAELLDNGQSKPIGAMGYIDNFYVYASPIGSPGSLNNGSQFFVPVNDPALTSLAPSGVTVTTNSSAVTLVGNFNDAYSGAEPQDERATINWGDGSASVAIISAAQGTGLFLAEPAAFVATANHIFDSDGTHFIVATIVDSVGATAEISTSYTGGLQLENNGDLRDYNGSSFSVLDSGVKSFLLRQSDSTVFSLHSDGTLWSISPAGTQKIDADVSSMFFGSNDTLFVLHGDGILSSEADPNPGYSRASAGTVFSTTWDGNVVTLDQTGNLYLSNNPTTPALTGVAQVLQWGAFDALVAIQTNGQLWSTTNPTQPFVSDTNVAQALIWNGYLVVRTPSGVLMGDSGNGFVTWTGAFSNVIQMCVDDGQLQVLDSAGQEYGTTGGGPTFINWYHAVTALFLWNGYLVDVSSGALQLSNGNGVNTVLSGGVTTAWIGNDGALYADDGGVVESTQDGTTFTVYNPALKFSDSNVEALVADAAGDLYKLDTSGALSVSTAGSAAWTPLLGNVKSVVSEGAYQFNGGNVAFNIPQLNTAAGGSNTVSFWMKWDGTGPEMPIEFQGYDLDFSSNGYFGFNSGNGDNYGIRSSGLAGNWHFLTVVFTNAEGSQSEVSQNQLWVDGVKQTLSQVLGTPLAASVSSSGSISDTSEYTFSGELADFAFFNSALTPSQIQAQYAAAATGNFDSTIRGQGPVAYYKLDETSGTTALDSSPNGNNAQINGSIALGAEGPPVGVNVLTNAGVDWQYVGAAGTLIAGPHLSLQVAPTATAGQSVTATLSVLDVNDNPVPGYTGTVTFSDSDAAAVAASNGPPATHSFSTADDGRFSFPLTFLTSGPQTLSVASRGVYQFDGGNVAFNIPQIDTSPGGTNTVSFWMKWGGMGPEMPIEFASYDLEFSSNGYFGFNTGNGDLYGISSSALAGNWHFITAIFANADGSQSEVSQDQLWIDGVRQSLSQVLGTPLAATVSNSGWISDTDEYTFSGELADVAFFNTALSAAQAQSQYAAASSGDFDPTILGQDPVAYYMLDETGGTAAFDSSPNGNNAQISGSIVLGADRLTTSASLTVNSAPATQFSVDPPAVPVGAPIAITAASWDSDVVTITTPPITGGLSPGDTLTISGMTPAGYNGTVTIASVLSDTQFTYLLTTDPGAATGLGTVTALATIGVTAYDAFGNVATGYTGTVNLAPVDNSAASPLTYNYTAADNGMHQFSETFQQPGGQKLVATSGSLFGDGAIVVTPAPYDLGQSSVSVNPQSVAADGQVLVTLAARDALRNAETSGGLQVAFDLGAASVGGGSFSSTTDNHDGTYTAIFTAGSFAGLDNITATIGAAPLTSSPAPLVITPAITSVNNATFVAGTDETFSVTQTGTAAPVFSESGKLPSGVTFDTSTGTLSGKPALGSGGVYNLLLGAATASGPAGTQNFTLVVDQPPTITSGDTTTFTPNTAGNFAVTTAAGTYPSPTFSETGALPGGVTLSPSGVLSGIPSAASGVYVVTITATNGVAPDANEIFSLDVPGASISGTEGFAFPMSYTLSGVATGNYSAEIHWGDGQSSAATVSSSAAGDYTIVGSHAYAEAGSYTLAADITYPDGSVQTATEQAFVADAPLSVAPASLLSLTEGVAFNGAVATITDGNTLGSQSDYSATIDWGDHTSLTIVNGSALTQTGPGEFSVPGSHVYAEEGAYSLTVTVNDEAGATATATQTIAVVDAALTGAVAAAATGGVEGVTAATLSGTTYVDADTSAPLSDFSIAAVNWGDGQTGSVGLSISGSGGTYTVTGSHLYAEDGAHSFTITLKDAGGSTATITGSANVADAPITAMGGTVQSTEGATLTGTLATFIDADPSAPASDYSATIDWGDHSSLTTMSGPQMTEANGTWSVAASHVYELAGTYSATVTIADAGGETAAATVTVTVAPAQNYAAAIITTVAGGGAGQGGPATTARLNAPFGVAVDSAGNLFIADTRDNLIREVDYTTGIITTVAGGGTTGLGDGGPATAAELDQPQGVALDSSGDLFIADTGNNLIREVNHATGVITTVAGGGTAGLGDGGPATAAELDGPSWVAVDSSGDLFIADYYDNRIREVDHATGVITTVAGNGTAGLNGDGGPATTAELHGPSWIAVDSSGNLFITDHLNNRIREVDHATGIITTVAGGGTVGLGDGGPATAAALAGPVGIAVDSSGDLFIADTGNSRIREVDHATGIITTVAGNATTGFRGDGGPATAAELSGPDGVAVDSSGDLFIADTNNNRIREVTSGPPPLVANNDVYVVGSGTVSVTAADGVLENDTAPVQLTVTTGTVTGANGGTFAFNVDGSFTYTPPANFANLGFDYAGYTAQDTAGDSRTATVNVLSQPGGVIWKFFEQVLHRDPAPTDLAFFIPLLAEYGSGVLAADFFESDELLGQLITGFYDQYLGRAPQGTDLSFWEAAWRQYGGPELIVAQFASSAEFNTLANNQYGSGPGGWVTALYERILNRTPRPGIDVPFWEQQLAGGTTEGQVALDFVASNEGFGDDVTGWFKEYLGRAPTANEQSAYVNQMLGGASDRTIEEAITSLGEYADEPSAPPDGTGVRLPDYVPPWSSAAQQTAAVSAKDAVFSELGR